MSGDQALFPMGPMTNTPRPEGVLEFGLLQWVIFLGSITVFVLLVVWIVLRIVRQRRQPLLHSADERLLRERGASAELTAALGRLGRERAQGRLNEVDYARQRAELLKDL
jgi:hypothetical protein